MGKRKRLCITTTEVPVEDQHLTESQIHASPTDSDQGEQPHSEEEGPYSDSQTSENEFSANEHYSEQGMHS